MLSISQDKQIFKKLYIKYQPRHKLLKNLYVEYQSRRTDLQETIKYQSRHKMLKNLYVEYQSRQIFKKLYINRLSPNDPYMGRTAPRTCKRCILYMYSTNIGTEYFKHAVYSLFFSLQYAVCFIMLTCLVPVLFTFYIQGVLKLKK